MKYVILSIVCLLNICLSCSNSNTSNGENYFMDTIENNDFDTIIHKSVFYDKTNDPDIKVDTNLILFDLSSCQRDCMNDTGKVISNELLNNTLHLKLSTWFNCAYDQGYLKEIKFKNDTLNIIITTPHSLVYDKKYGWVEEHAVTDCNCYYLITVKYERTSIKPNTILINSREIVKFGYRFD
jgi:hypothetical protein